ncbi:hypothetical protein AMTR_s00041p00202210 [Amborella trichopoda]|uniref:PPIase cyclophilin-type domain-containing protein n=1 Tax=Amborella trichopoda TaxID=13333 RepID=W1PZ77_AMBTC|nr:hypothetical protein AMTR_s00041p00202210 [Amborella trichopoda]
MQKKKVKPQTRSPSITRAPHSIKLFQASSVQVVIALVVNQSMVESLTMKYHREAHDNNGSMFCIDLSKSTAFEERCDVFGGVVEGLDVVWAIKYVRTFSTFSGLTVKLVLIADCGQLSRPNYVSIGKWSDWNPLLFHPINNQAKSSFFYWLGLWLLFSPIFIAVSFTASPILTAVSFTTSKIELLLFLP